MLNNWIIFGTFFLCINAGYINNLTNNTQYHIASAHMTGNVAKIGDYVFNHEYLQLLYITITYLSFILGCIITGIYIKSEVFNLSLCYGNMLLFIAFIQIIGLLLEYFYTNSIFFILACSMSCGLQNSLTSKYSGNIIRTTHLTGTTTDFGLTIGHLIKGEKHEKWKLLLLSTSIFGFLIGSFLGSYAYYKINHYAIVINIIITLFCATIHIIYKKCL